jgi:hypothetical protein
MGDEKSSSLPFARCHQVDRPVHVMGEDEKSSSLPFARGGLGWGKF